MYSITATDLARNTREILDKITSQGATVVVERNHVMIAKIVPAEKTMTAAQALAGLQPRLTAKQAKAWLQNSRGGFDQTVSNPWE